MVFRTGNGDGHEDKAWRGSTHYPGAGRSPSGPLIGECPYGVNDHPRRSGVAPEHQSQLDPANLDVGFERRIAVQQTLVLPGP